MTQSGYDHLSSLYVYAIHKVMICYSKKKEKKKENLCNVLLRSRYARTVIRCPMKHSRGYFVTP